MHIGRFGGNHIRSGISFETGKIRHENVGAGGPDQINEAEKLWTAVCPGLSWEPVSRSPISVSVWRVSTVTQVGDILNL